MDPIKGVVTPMAQNLNQGKYVVPPLAMGCFYLFHRVHRCWRWYLRITDIYIHRHNFEKLVAGHIFHYVVGNNLLVRIAAQTVLIARRIVDCAQQQAAFGRAYHDWTNALKGRCWPQYAPEYQDLKAYHGLWSPSTAVWWTAKKRLLCAVVKRIVVCTLYLFKEGFKLSMCIMDVIEAFSLSVEKGNESVNDLFINSSKLLDELIGNKQLLLEELASHRDVIQRILTRVGSKVTVEQLTASVGGTIDKVDTAYQLAGKVPYGIKEGLKDGSYTLLYSTLGWAPLCLLPQKSIINPPLKRLYGNNSRVHPPCHPRQSLCWGRYYPPPFAGRRESPAHAGPSSENSRLHA